MSFAPSSSSFGGHTVVMMEALADILVDVRAIKALLEEDDEQDDAGGEG